MSQISHAFYRFVAKYRITTFMEHKDGCQSKTTRFDDSVKVELWLGMVQDGLIPLALNYLDKLEALRKHFAPNQVLSDQDEGVCKSGHRT